MSISRDLFTTRVNSTMMSINQRFTYLLKNARPMQTTVQSIRAAGAQLQQASAKNRRLAMQMERRLSAMAALKIKKKSIRQRLGVPTVVIGQRGSIRDRLTLGQRGRGRGAGRARGRRSRPRSLSRSQSMQSLQNFGGVGGSLQRTLSMQSLNQQAQPRDRSRSRSRSRIGARSRARTPSVGPSQVQRVEQIRPARRRQRSQSAGARQRVRGGGNQMTQVVMQWRPARGSGRGRARGRGGINARRTVAEPITQMVQTRGRVRSRRGSNQRAQLGQQLRRYVVSYRGAQQQLTRGRGRGRARGRGMRRGRGGGRAFPGGVPSKEELDQQLDSYMANTRTHLDRELDSYMKQSGLQEIWD